jgi:hypothetical protein
LEDGAAVGREGRFPHCGVVPTGWIHGDEPHLPSRAVVRFYSKRRMAEQWITEGKQSVKTTRLSCHRFQSNQMHLWLTVIAYNLGNLRRRQRCRGGVTTGR